VRRDAPAVLVIEIDIREQLGPLAGARRQCVPGRERVHIVSPVRDFPVFNLDDRTKPIVVLHACREDGPMDLIFDDDDTAVVRLVGNQLIGRLKLDVVAIASELGHQIARAPG
jgi:hypothetical protein